MRKIKFRIYDKELKESHIEELEDLCEDDYWYDGETEVWSVLKDCNNKQERFVALQYTGLEDKNNYEIYEGDIVKATYEFENNETSSEIGVVKNKIHKFILENRQKYEFEIEYFDYLEVIGNVWDNPELLERS